LSHEIKKHGYNDGGDKTCPFLSATEHRGNYGIVPVHGLSCYREYRSWGHTCPGIHVSLKIFFQKTCNSTTRGECLLKTSYERGYKNVPEVPAYLIQVTNIAGLL
jgi:hypothetical protein